MSNLNALSGNFKDADVDMTLIEEAIRSWAQAGRDVSDTAKSIKGTSQSIQSVVANDLAPAISRLDSVLQNTNQTLESFSTLAQTGAVTANDIRDAVNRLSNSGLNDLQETTDAMRELMITLNEIADQLERNPAQFLVGEESEVMELPQ